MFKQKRVAIMGTGKIAGVMAGTIKKMKNVKCYGVASRNEARAQEFANEYGIKVAYASYEEMMLDDKIDLVYIATPHSEHYANMIMCIENNKNVLCEKSFTTNARQAEEVLALASEKGVFVAEAMWVRYMPMLTTIKGILSSGIIGEPTMLTANICYNIAHKQRMTDPALSGGALLDLGVYVLNFAVMMFGRDIDSISSTCTLTDTGVDASESITLTFKDKKMAVLNSSMNAIGDRRGIIYGTKGYIEVENINNFASVTVYDTNYKAGKALKAPKQITGYEYEVYSCLEAIDKGEMECWEMPHEETLRIMRLMDEIRAGWGVKYPCEVESESESADTNTNIETPHINNTAVDNETVQIDAVKAEDSEDKSTEAETNEVSENESVKAETSETGEDGSTEAETSETGENESVESEAADENNAE